MLKLFGVVLVMLGLWQVYASKTYFQSLKKDGNQSTSAFSPIAIYSGFIFGLMFIMIGIKLIAS